MYTDGKVAFQLASASVASTGVKGFIAPAFPMKLRSVIAIVTTATTTTPPVITIKHRPTAGSATAEATVDTITIPNATAVGKGLYVVDLNQLVKPGEHIAFDVTTAAAAGVVDIQAHLDPAWEEPQNNTNLTLSA